MADNQTSSAASGAFKLPRWGPPMLRQICEAIENRINMITPIAGLDISVDVTAGGSQISQKVTTSTPDDSSKPGAGSGGGGAGTVYGFHNGVAAIFHFKQTSAPTAIP